MNLPTRCVLTQLGLFHGLNSLEGTLLTKPDVGWSLQENLCAPVLVGVRTSLTTLIRVSSIVQVRSMKPMVEQYTKYTHKEETVAYMSHEEHKQRLSGDVASLNRTIDLPSSMSSRNRRDTWGVSTPYRCCRFVRCTGVCSLTIQARRPVGNCC